MFEIPFLKALTHVWGPCFVNFIHFTFLVQRLFEIGGSEFLWSHKMDSRRVQPLLS